MPRYYEFEICLQDIHPRIWRRLLMQPTATFADLHAAIQNSFGWRDCHLWEFRPATPHGRPIAGSSGGDDYGPPTPDAHRVKLNSHFTGEQPGKRCEYVYDFGDGWVHEVKFVAVRTEKETFQRRLLDGKRSGPMEDCGGIPGYLRMVHFLETGVDPDDEDPEMLTSWIGSWRPDAFDPEKARARFDR